MLKTALSDLLSDVEVAIMGGTGGVGKTTLSAALALSAAAQGRRVAVLTIDPARRLGVTLGFRKLGNQLKFVSPKKLDPFRESKGGVLAAAMLDAKGTFDEMVRRYAPTPHLATQIIDNPLYGELSNALSGTHEYMALEKIYEIRQSKEFDLLVLDTPPSGALGDFLSAPAKLKAFLDREVVRWFLPNASVVGKGLEWGFSVFQKLSGGTLFEDLVEFLGSFQTLYEGLGQRIQTVEGWIRDPHTSFFLVSTPDLIPHREVLNMAEGLIKDSVPLSGIFLNRILPEENFPGEISNPSSDPFSDFALQMVDRQKRVEKEIEKKFGKIPVFKVLLQEKDPTTLEDLAKLLLR